MPKVHLPDGRIVHFPDEMSPQDIEAAVSKLVPAQEAPAEDPGFLSNAVTSAGNFLGNTARGVKDLGQMALAGGAMMAGKPGVTAALMPDSLNAIAEDPVGAAKGVGQYVGDRYGSIGKVGHTLYTDPVGAAADAATVLTLGGGAAARAPGLVGRLGRGAAALGNAVDPLAAAGRVAKTVATPAAALGTKLARKLNTTALNVPESLAKRNPGVDIPLEAAKEGVLVTKGSAGRLKKAIGQDTNDLAQAIDRSTAQISTEEALGPLKDLQANRQAVARSRPGETEAVGERILDLQTQPGPGVMTPREAQTQKLALSEEYDPTKSGLQRRIERAERKGYEQAIEKAVPEAGPLNKRLATRKAISKAQTRAVDRAEKVPLSSVFKRTVDNPAALSLLATGSYHGGQAFPLLASGLEQAGPTLTRLALLEQLRSEGR